METNFEESTINLSTAFPMQWNDRLATMISDILCPPVTILLGMLLLVYSLHDPQAWYWAFVIIFLVIGVPVMYIARQVKAGAISDFHIPIRSQRFGPMLLTVICAIAAWVILMVGGAPGLLISFLFFGVLQSAFMLLITLRWKISGHSAAIAGLVMLLILLDGPALIPLMVFIPIVAWARIHLRRHTLSQTIAGALSGIVFILLVLH